MNKRPIQNPLFLFLILIVFSLGINTAECAEPQAQNSELLESYIDSLPPYNPFKPQLPEKVVEPVIPPTPPRNITPTPRTTAPAPSFLPGAAETTEEQPRVILPVHSVTGIIWNSDRPQAIINDQVVDEGAVISEMKIVTIRKDGIDILYQGQLLTITP